MLTSYQQLKVWQRGIELVAEIYRLTKLFPREELYGLSSQMRRSAVSIPSNIAEGYARKHRQEYIQFLRIAYGSSSELETQIIIAKMLNFLEESAFRAVENFVLEVKKMLSGLIKSVTIKQ